MPFDQEDSEIDKNSIYFKALLKSSLIFKIKGMAASLFDVWVGLARQKYANYSYQAKNEVLIEDLVVAFAKGLEFVCRKENEAKRSMPGWSEGLILDTASVTLNTHWSLEYIYKQSHEYRELCFLTTLSQFLKADAVALKRIEALYRHKVKAGQEPEFETKDKVVDLKQFKKNKKSDSGFKKNITDYLDSLYYEKHYLVFGDILRNKPGFALGDYFSLDEVRDLIDGE